MKSGGEDEEGLGIVAKARDLYNLHAQGAVKNLMDFLATLDPGKPCLAVTYFDEAPELELCFWIMLRLLSNQAISKNMWYVFMGTKSSISYFSPAPKNCESFMFSPLKHISLKDSAVPATPKGITTTAGAL
jgi:hypothetical protein